MTMFIITRFVTFADLLNLSEPLALSVGRDHNIYLVLLLSETFKQKRFVSHLA